MVNNLEVYKEIELHLLEDEEPSKYLRNLLNYKSIQDQHPFTFLRNLMDCPQSPQHHPEGNVWNHTLMVVDEAAKRRNKSEEPRSFMWAALLHDLGKVPTTRIRKGKVTSYDHDLSGEKLAKEFLDVFGEEDDFIKKVTSLVRWHMQALFVVKKLPFANIEQMLSQVHLEEIALLTLCDRIGRGKLSSEKREEEEENIRLFIKECTNRI